MDFGGLFFANPDPLDLIKTYGADGVRTGMLFSSPAGNDLLFDEKLCEQGRNFANKIWNAFRLVKGWTTVNHPQPEENKVATDWFESRLNNGIAELNDHFAKYRMSDALMSVYKLIWDDFCSWYLEIIKPEYGKPIDTETYQRTVEFFEAVLKLLHPFMPFITEELWSELRERKPGESIVVAKWPASGQSRNDLLEEAQHAFAVVSEVRNVRSSKGLSPREALPLFVKDGQARLINTFWPVVKKLANLSEVNPVTEKVGQATSFLVKSTEFYITLGGKVDVEKEREALTKELDYQRGFLASCEKKLSNERFVAGAPPQVLDNERRKKADAESKIKALEEQLRALA